MLGQSLVHWSVGGQCPLVLRLLWMMILSVDRRDSSLVHNIIELLLVHGDNGPSYSDPLSGGGGAWTQRIIQS